MSDATCLLTRVRSSADFRLAEEPLEYSSLADAEASFLLHLRQFGWIKYLNRGRHSISFMPEDTMGAQVEFGPGGAAEGSLRRLLEEAVKVDSVRIKK